MKHFNFIIILSILFSSCYTPEKQAEKNSEKINIQGKAQGTTFSITYYDDNNVNYRSEIDSIKTNVSGIRESLIDLAELFKEFKEQEDQKKTQNLPQNSLVQQEEPFSPQQTNRQRIPTHQTHPSTHNTYFKPLKYPNLGISNGNQGSKCNDTPPPWLPFQHGGPPPPGSLK